MPYCHMRSHTLEPSPRPFSPLSVWCCCQRLDSQVLQFATRNSGYYLLSYLGIPPSHAHLSVSLSTRQQKCGVSCQQSFAARDRYPCEQHLMLMLIRRSAHARSPSGFAKGLQYNAPHINPSCQGPLLSIHV